MTKKYFKAILFLAFFVVATNVYAPPPPPPPVTPIDGGIVYLLISAIAFGVTKLWNKNK